MEQDILDTIERAKKKSKESPPPKIKTYQVDNETIYLEKVDKENKTIRWLWADYQIELLIKNGGIYIKSVCNLASRCNHYYTLSNLPKSVKLKIFSVTAGIFEIYKPRNKS